MNNKGFTLIELLAIVLLLAIVSTIGTYAISSYIKTARTKADKLLKDNIDIAAKEYIDECTSGVTTLNTCNMVTTEGNNTTASTTLGLLAKDGFLNTVTDSRNKIVVLDSKKNNIGSCKVGITKVVNPNTNYQVTYDIKLSGNCGTLLELEG